MIRVVLFEKLTTLFAWVWWGAALIVSLLTAYIDWSVSALVIVGAMVLYRPLQRFFLGKRHLLIRRGDTVEYAEPDENTQIQQFQTAKVLRTMTPENAEKTETFDTDQLAYYEHFFLVETGKQNRVIPYEWIIALEAEALEL